MAGETYTKRYAGGFANGSGGGTPIDATFLNAVETALLYLLGEDPASNEVPVWTPASSRFVFQKITNAQIDAAAAIDKTKLGSLAIVDADVSGAAAIAQSKIALDITNSQINAAAAIAISKLASYPNARYKRLLGDGTWGTPSQGYGTLIDVVSSAAETDILQAAGYSVPANSMGSTGSVRATIHFDYLNNTGGSLALPTVRVYFGGTKIIDTGAGAGAAATANRQAGYMILDVQNRGATNSQIATLRLHSGQAGGLTTGNGSTWGDTSGAGQRLLVAQNTAAIDTTSAATLRVTVQLSSSSASHELRAFGSVIEFV